MLYDFRIVYQLINLVCVRIDDQQLNKNGSASFEIQEKQHTLLTGIEEPAGLPNFVSNLAPMLRFIPTMLLMPSCKSTIMHKLLLSPSALCSSYNIPRQWLKIPYNILTNPRELGFAPFSRSSLTIFMNPFSAADMSGVDSSSYSTENYLSVCPSSTSTTLIVSI